MDMLQIMINNELGKQAIKRSNEMLTLGQFIEKLEKLNPDWDVLIEPFHLVPDYFTSYRGYYEDLTLTYKTRAEANFEYIKVGQLLQKAKECVNKEFTGYKGGEFLMDLNTPLWVSDSDYTTGMAIQDIVEAFDGQVDILTYKKD